MSSRNLLSAREKNLNKINDCFPVINKANLRRHPDLPAIITANKSNLLNRNLNYTYEPVLYAFDSNRGGGSPFSDFYSESESGTPDFRSEESDSSTGSVLRKNTAHATKILAEEWEKLERTLYDEDGEKCTRPQIIEECKQWRELHPQIRIVGKSIQLPETRLCCRQIEHEEVIALHYSDYEHFSESDERHSQSSTDVTPQNTPPQSPSKELHEPKLTREKVSFLPTYNEDHILNDTFGSVLQITPIQVRSPTLRKRTNPSVWRSEVASSRWMRGSRPDSSTNGERGSAKSFLSLDIRGYSNIAWSASEHKKLLQGRNITARPRDLAKLDPTYSPDMNDNVKFVNGNTQQCYKHRKVSLPPLLSDEERRKLSAVNSAKKVNVKARRNAKTLFHIDRLRH